MNERRRRMRVVGIVQGVGFRPFVAQLATGLGLSGWVCNTTGAVVIEVQGTAAAISEFAFRLEHELPSAAVIEHVEAADIPVEGSGEFQIKTSEAGHEAASGLPPDLAMCDECRRELCDPADRRYQYPFLNCTACGPRYTIVSGLPYDRPQTSMSDFPMCAACQAEYDNPKDRRFHAQPIACPQCGPQLSFEPGGEVGAAALRQAIDALRGGQIGAIRSLGGFHLACVARDAKAVSTLRDRKARGEQPFAVMVRDLDVAAEFVMVDERASRLLRSAAAPIVLLPKRGSTALGESLAPGNGFLGVMMPYSPLHHLLLHAAPDIDALVMTSGNRHGEPIATTKEEARHSLGGLADFFLLHNREIVARCDDSVVRLYRGRALAIRRARGYAPLPARMTIEAPPMLAVGADLKASFAISDGSRVLVSPHIGDMENLETIESFERTLQHLTGVYQIEPAQIVHDAHPGYRSTQWALRYAHHHSLPAIAIQHHRAHAASVMAEYGLSPDTPVVAVVFDGTGYGDDGAIWGGEFFRGPAGDLERAFHVPYVALPGGDASARRPAFCALAQLFAGGIDPAGTPCWSALTTTERRVLPQQLERGLRCHATSSVGRLFDAAASLLDIRHRVAYEAQAAIELEARASGGDARGAYHATPWSQPELWAELLADGAAVETRARRFTDTIAKWTCETTRRLIDETRCSTVVLSGGVFQNVLLLEAVTTALESQQLRVLVPRYLPPNDGGVALGQAYLAALMTTKPKPVASPAVNASPSSR